ncbi:MAG: diacylglycerol/lipid kinase family protein [Polyangiales bacterium]
MSALSAQHWWAVINPRAGAGRAQARVHAALAALRPQLAALHIVQTNGPGHGAALAAAAAVAGADGVLAVGGDGTLFDVVCGLMQHRHCDPAPGPALGLLPAGTGNSFIQDLGPSDWRHALARLQQGQLRPVDVLEVQHTEGLCHALNLVSVGFTAQVGALTNRRFKALGAAGYAAATLSCLRRLRPQARVLALDAAPPWRQADTFIALCNSRYTGGRMQMAPAARIDDGRLDVIRVGALSRRALLRAFPRIYRGRHTMLPAVTAQQATMVRLGETGARPTLEDVMIDGEIRPLAIRQVRVCKHALRICA